ncbi:hypothetical protein BCR32DRAFT_285020 [Anaeromyces robustus]|uniref:BAAT/Acyl-CoA thioester hydrolase C-terminal domain-containing protein n=1 Tax=Anaeromyces robustus TaxID=1754192 RepID=A0A1Y1WQC9_9FUNG|nr:hypothetical protein BCR32DRAFT_285020 [Anaeromyces robustus]|eukprot:ORX75605.1 hypothetical protein BCR32DRAFT_285020 [Anaeromyces robustus]
MLITQSLIEFLENKKVNIKNLKTFLFIISTFIFTTFSSPIISKTTIKDIKGLINAKLFLNTSDKKINNINDVISDFTDAVQNGIVDFNKLETIFSNLFNITVVDPIENLIDSKNHKTFSVKKDGFYGELFEPENNRFPGKALILCTGSDGDFNMVRSLSKGLSNNGITVLGLGYFKVKGTPNILTSIPLEYVESAAKYLKSEGFEKIGMWGFSAGSVYALLSGVYFSDLLSLIVVTSPGNYVFQGKDIPYEPIGKVDPLKIVYLMIRDLEPNFVHVYEPGVTGASESHYIPVEKMKARLLIFSGEMDHCWPSDKASKAIMKRLKENNYSYPYEHISCPYGGHVMTPFPTAMDIITKASRDYPEEEKKYRKQHLEKLLEAFEEW